MDYGKEFKKFATQEGGFTYFTFLVVNVNTGFPKRVLVEEPFSKIRMLVTLRLLSDTFLTFSENFLSTRFLLSDDVICVFQIF